MRRARLCASTAMQLRLSPLPFLALLTSAALAQVNPFLVFPQDPERQTITAASYVRRPDWNSAAEGFQEAGNVLFRGIGDETSGCVVRGFYHWAADENIATAETYDIVLRTGSPTPGNGPDPSPAGELLRVANLSTPTSGGGPRGSFIISNLFATPVGVPCQAEWFFGLAMPGNANWPATDGHAMWAADIPGISPATVGENPRTGSPRVTWRIGAASAVATTDWTYIMGVLTGTPALHVGGNDPLSMRQGASGGANLGMGGMFPDVSGTPRRDGLVVRIHDNAVPSGIAYFFAAVGFSPVPVALPGFSGRVHADPTSLIMIGPAAMSGGAAELTLAPPNTLPTSLRGSLVLQGLVFDPATTTGAFANAQRTLF
jgi:hypothetical protein